MDSDNIYRGPSSVDPPAPTNGDYFELWVTVVAALLLLGVAGLTGSYLFFAGLAILLVPAQVAFGVGALRMMVIRMGIFALVAVTLIVCARYESGRDSRQLDALIAACHAYNDDRGHYPQELSELVPDFLRAVPVFSSSKEYVYFADSENNRPRLLYMPAFGLRSWYSFAEREWTHQVT